MFHLSNKFHIIGRVTAYFNRKVITLTTKLFDAVNCQLLLALQQYMAWLDAIILVVHNMRSDSIQKDHIT